MADQLPVMLTARNASLQDVVTILKDQQARKLDVVAPSTAIRASEGKILVHGVEAEMTEEGVTPVDGVYQPTDIFDEGISSKLEIPRAYVRRMRNSAIDLYDANVNGWLQGSAAAGREPDDRKFLLRLFRGSDASGGRGVARSLLSNSYKVTMDHLDMLTAVLGGVTAAGVKTEIRTADLSERRLHVRIEVPDVTYRPEHLLTGYRNPFSEDGGQALRAGGRTDRLGRQVGDVVGLFFDFDNSETGGGSYTLVPGVLVLVCLNGQVIPKYKYSKIHLGARLAEGVVDISLDTVRKAAELVKAETRDAVRSWLNPDFLPMMVRELEETAVTPIRRSTDVVQTVGQRLAFTEEEQSLVLDLFIAGGQMTAGGIMHAVSAVSQTIEDPDRAFEFERLAVPAMEAAAEAVK